MLAEGEEHAKVKWTMLGLREVARAIENHKLRAVIVANDLEVNYGDLSGLPKELGQLGQGSITAKAVAGALAAAAAATAANVDRLKKETDEALNNGAEQKGEATSPHATGVSNVDPVQVRRSLFLS